MSNTAARISDDIKTAMRARDTTALNSLRALKSALTNATIEKGGAGADLEETEILSVIRKQIKQRHDSIGQFEKAGRTELAATEKMEIEILSKYLPAALTPQQLAEIVARAISETGASSRADMGKVIKHARELSEDRADGKLLSAMVVKSLS